MTKPIKRKRRKPGRTPMPPVNRKNIPVVVYVSDEQLTQVGGMDKLKQACRDKIAELVAESISNQIFKS